MPIIDKESMQNMVQLHRQTQVRQPQIELYVEFENVEADIENDRATVYERLNTDSKNDFKTTYEAGDEDEDVLLILRTEFRIGMEYNFRKSIVAVIKSYTICRGVNYNLYESEPQTLYEKFKTYGHGCDWLIRASLIQKKGCWEIRKYNDKHMCIIGTISQDHSKLDLDTVAEAIRPLVKTDPSINVKSIIAKVQSMFSYTICYRKA
ncbi:hypothetical protein Ahy_A03g015844 [Arachis hypogaea]|uniref:Transposase MuDR plant domain-containing protein n=1 Tax=Arachis hypogaea TaxID=3818 RepID=A0A445E1C6_ARAHY|nr:hypothetical protein Ahy_A03g015844 [Arachis hypogaea]